MSKLGQKTGKQKNPRGKFTLDERVNFYVKRNKLNLDDKQLKYLRICLDIFPKSSYISNYIKTFIKLNLNFWPNRIRRILKNPFSTTKKKNILMYGKIIGLEKWNEYCRKQSETNTFEYKSKKYGMTLDEFDEFNKSRAVTLQNLIVRHGDINGTRKWNEYCKRQSYTNSLEYFIEKLGTLEGEIFYKNLNKQKSLSLANFIGKYGEIEGFDRYCKHITKRNESGSICKYYSKISQRLFDNLRTDNTKYATNGGEYIIRYDDSTYLCDFIDTSTQKCIEFNGDYWHRNPLLYDKSFTDYNGLTEDIWAKDYNKIKALINKGLDVLIIWEYDFKKNPQQIIDTCRKFLEYD